MSTENFSFKDYSLSPVDLVPDELDEPDEVSELDARQARYRRLGKLLDVDDLIEVIIDKLRDSSQLRWMVEDAIQDPQAEIWRPRLHVSELVRMGQQVLDTVAIVVDEQVSMLDVTVPED
jgi:hypothetical protein